jgi:hypothetical protein
MLYIRMLAKINIHYSNMSEKKENIEKDRFLQLFIKIAIAFLILSVIFPFSVNYFFNNWQNSGTFGDTFGALNALFSGLALAGVIVTILIQRSELKHQRTELSLQRFEMTETRKEFLLNRTTSLVYQQLDRFENAIEQFNIKHDDITHVGNDAMLFLERNKQLTFMTEEDTEDEETMKAAVIELFNIYASNILEIEKLARSSYNSVLVLQQLIGKTNLDISDLNDLKDLFFLNIGFVKMAVLERILDVSKLQYKYLKPEDYIENGIQFDDISRVDIFLRPVIDFYKLTLTPEYFQVKK